MDNPNPQVLFDTTSRQKLPQDASLKEKIFEAIRDIRDPEHPYTLEQLSVIDRESIIVYEKEHLHTNRLQGIVQIVFTPTVPHCSLASLIGLCIIARLRDKQILPPRYKLDVKVCENTHDTAEEITKQLCDKERVFAALENTKLRQVIDDCLSKCKQLDILLT
eukprot:jgi/Galph1/558/GphlegSOOS_G5422.1